MLSARQAAVAALDSGREGGEAARQGAETWLNELIWREFYMAILYHFPHVLEQAFREDLRDILWRNDPADFAAWCEGRTGYPVVDAAMRQLVQTGWMHNRARMIAASFLVKDLLVDWRWGERFFMQHLVDGDPAANNGGWQWTAGVGTDAAPYFRVFNPSLQGAKFDPDGEYVRRWVPELAQVPTKYIHEPWKMPVDVQRQAGASSVGTIRPRSWITFWRASACWQRISNQGGTSARSRDLATAYCYDPLYLEHNKPGHPENRGRLESIMQRLADDGLLDRMTLIRPRPAHQSLLTRVHDRPYVLAVQEAARGRGGWIDSDTYIGPHSYEVADLAAGGVVELVRAVLSGRARERDRAGASAGTSRDRAARHGFLPVQQHCGRGPGRAG